MAKEVAIHVIQVTTATVPTAPSVWPAEKENMETSRSSRWRPRHVSHVHKEDTHQRKVLEVALVAMIARQASIQQQRRTTLLKTRRAFHVQLDSLHQILAQYSVIVLVRFSNPEFFLDLAKFSHFLFQFLFIPDIFSFLTSLFSTLHRIGCHCPGWWFYRCPSPQGLAHHLHWRRQHLRQLCRVSSWLVWR